MTPNQLLLEGVELMLYGIGSVFVFLVLLIYCIRLMSFCLVRFEIRATSAVRLNLTTYEMADLDDNEFGAIQAAIHQHRARRG
jgi:oxaloacetate decarboxylase gamma subunit